MEVMPFSLFYLFLCEALEEMGRFVVPSGKIKTPLYFLKAK